MERPRKRSDVELLDWHVLGMVDYLEQVQKRLEDDQRLLNDMLNNSLAKLEQAYNMKIGGKEGTDATGLVKWLVTETKQNDNTEALLDRPIVILGKLIEAYKKGNYEVPIGNVIEDEMNRGDKGGEA